MVVLFVPQQKKQENKAPDKDAILKATAALSTKHTDRTVTQHNIRDVRIMRSLKLWEGNTSINDSQCGLKMI